MKICDIIIQLNYLLSGDRLRFLRSGDGLLRCGESSYCKKRKNIFLLTYKYEEYFAIANGMNASLRHAFLLNTLDSIFPKGIDHSLTCNSSSVALQSV